MTSKSAFHYRGVIPASKSIFNRLLVMKSYEPALEIVGSSDADDVVKMKSALAQLERGEVADCGHAGTTLRFLAFRASRIPGRHHLSGSRRLFERPQSEIERVLKQLGCEVSFGPQRLTISGDGWKVPQTGVVIDRSISSQFSSALLLNAWGLAEDLNIRFQGTVVSESYFEMTCALLNRMGAELRKESDDSGQKNLVVARNSKVNSGKVTAEIDLSSAFAVAALAIAHGGIAEFEAWPEDSLQPDRVFPEILREMGCEVLLQRNSTGAILKISRSPGKKLNPITRNLGDAPDLFPILSVLCALAEGRSRLEGAPHLAFKESSRIDRSAEIVHHMGRTTRMIEGGMEIEGTNKTPAGLPIVFSPDHDHRLAMAAAVARAAGLPIVITDPTVVTKSFASFWSIADQTQNNDQTRSDGEGLP